MIKVGSFTIKLVPNYYISSQFVNILIKYVTIVTGWKVAAVAAAASSGGGVADDVLDSDMTPTEVSSLRNFC